MVLSSAALILLTESVFAGFVPPAIVVLFAVLSQMELSTTAIGIVGLSLLANNVQERPGMGLHEGPLTIMGKYIFSNLEKSVGLPGGKLIGLEILMFGLVAFAIIRLQNRSSRMKSRGPLVTSAMVALAAWLVMEGWGFLRGGDMRLSLIQLRPFILLCLFVVILIHLFSEKTTKTFVRMVLGVSLLRSLVGIYYWFTLFRSGVVGPYAGVGDGTYVLTHSDSILMCCALTVCTYMILSKPDVGTIFRYGLLFVVIFLFVGMNNRRIAFVAYAASVGGLYFIIDAQKRRRMHLLGIAAVPMLMFYVAIAWNSQAGWASPVRSLRTVSTAEDGSSQSRVIENFNMVSTFRTAPVLGTGFGHEYVEAIPMPDISHVFKAYRYVPHNSVIGLMANGGILFTTFIWLFFAVFSFTIARTIKRAASLDERLLCISSMSCLTAYLMQAFGDMGLQSMMGAILIGSHSAHIAIIARLRGAFHTSPVTMSSNEEPQLHPEDSAETI